jgi:PIN domain nuclease of toxin-antitoxin system
MNLLLDTHAFIWCDDDPTRLGAAAQAACSDPANHLFLSAASAWEMQIKIMLGKLSLRNPLGQLITEQMRQNGVEILPVNLEHAPVHRGLRAVAGRGVREGQIGLRAGRILQRGQRITLPDKPAVGEVLGLAVCGDHGAILRFEMQATKGSGRIVPLGSIQKVMRESIEAAAQYVKAKREELGVTAEWRQSFDVAILATFMGVPKEGPSAGIALVVGTTTVQAVEEAIKAALIVPKS